MCLDFHSIVTAAIIPERTRTHFVLSFILWNQNNPNYSNVLFRSCRTINYVCIHIVALCCYQHTQFVFVGASGDSLDPKFIWLVTEKYLWLGLKLGLHAGLSPLHPFLFKRMTENGVCAAQWWVRGAEKHVELSLFWIEFGEWQCKCNLTLTEIKYSVRNSTFAVTIYQTTRAHFALLTNQVLHSFFFCLHIILLWIRYTGGVDDHRKFATKRVII